jgi:hypothetical protein
MKIFLGPGVAMPCPHITTGMVPSPPHQVRFLVRLFCINTEINKICVFCVAGLLSAVSDCIY